MQQPRKLVKPRVQLPCPSSWRRTESGRTGEDGSVGLYLVAWAGEELVANPPFRPARRWVVNPGVRSVQVRGWQRLPMKMAMVVVVALLSAPLAGMAPAGAAVPKVQVLVRVQPGSESAVAAQVKSLGGDPSAPLKVLVGFLPRFPPTRSTRVAPSRAS